jgi:preprotein translocase subunit SecE
MTKEKTAPASLLQELLQSGLYKRNQGRVARQVTFVAAAILVVLGAWQLILYYTTATPLLRYALPAALLVVGLWISYRVVNISRFADFLISVEGEMAKVSWPGRGELFRSSVVVIVTIVLLAAVLYCYDLLWRWVLTLIGILS